MDSANAPTMPGAHMVRTDSPESSGVPPAVGTAPPAEYEPSILDLDRPRALLSAMSQILWALGDKATDGEDCRPDIDALHTLAEMADEAHRLVNAVFSARLAKGKA